MRAVDGESRLYGVGQALVGADHARSEDRAAVVGARRVAPEHRVGDDPQPVSFDAKVGEHVATALGMDDDPVEALEQALPEPAPPRRAAREQVVRSEHERGARAEQRDVELGGCEPLQVKDLGGGGPGEQPAHVPRVLERPHGNSRGLALDPARSRIERLVERVPLGVGARAEAERGGDEGDFHPARASAEASSWS